VIVNSFVSGSSTVDTVNWGFVLDVHPPPTGDRRTFCNWKTAATSYYYDYIKSSI